MHYVIFLKNASLKKGKYSPSNFCLKNRFFCHNCQTVGAILIIQALMKLIVIMNDVY